MTPEEIKSGAPDGAHIYAVGNFGDVYFRKTPKRLYYWHKEKKQWWLSWMDGSISNRLRDYTNITKLVDISDDWEISKSKPL